MGSHSLFHHIASSLAKAREEGRQEMLATVQQIVTDTAQQWDDGEGSRTFNACMAIQDKLREMAKEGGKDG